MPAPLRKTLLNGLRRRCPSCGVGKLFASYLKPHKRCPHCQMNLQPYRADDGPAWLTILITGHVVVPLMVMMSRDEIFTYWTGLAVALSLTTVLALSLLPLTKGLFIAILWHNAPLKSNELG